MSAAATLDTQAFVDGVLAGNRGVLARAITLIESRNPHHRDQAAEVLEQVLPHTGGARRVGLSGVPGVGKSSLIESLGTALCDAGERVSVLAVDPSSQRTGGSILGDKTRMPRLTVHPNAFIRPSPAGEQLGGVAAATADTISLVEAAGFSTVIVETVGVGQSETLVSAMTDCFLVLMLPGAGDELQGIKKGIVELADIVAVNKADGDTAIAAAHAARDYEAALRTLQQRDAHWPVPVITCSATQAGGADPVHAQLDAYFQAAHGAGAIEARRARQRVTWLWQQLDAAMRARARARGTTAIDDIERAVASGALSTRTGAARLLTALFGD
ncbi:MAG: methylmalonyl Co-A mutase-associated GTPase MeaB [Pseudomonadota bacterium]